MAFFRPLPRRVTRPLSALILAAWIASLGLLIDRSYLQASAANLATDLARYGPTAQWRGVYYRGEKIGFTVSQTVRTEEGFELQEDGRLQMSLLGATTAATIRTTARVDQSFSLRAFDFSLDPGTGPIVVSGTVDGLRLLLKTTTAGHTRDQVIELDEPPALMLSLSRRLAAEGLAPGTRHAWTMFDPATMQNAPVAVEVGPREVVDANGKSMPAFRVDLTFSGLSTRAWVTDTGEVIREESPMGLLTVAEPADRAQQLAVPFKIQNDLLEASAVVPIAKERIGEPRDIRRLRLRLTGADLSSPDMQGVGQRVEGDIVEVTDARVFTPGPRPDDLARYLKAEPLIESDAPEIKEEAARALAGVEGTRAKAESLTRYVNFLLEKRPTVSIPSAAEVLRTKVGDCNEHTALYVALARAAGIPARIAVGLVSVRNAFYYHAWPEVWIDEGPATGYWLPVDPTFNQFPADATHLRLARGGLDKQVVILPLIGKLQMTVIDVELVPGTDRVIVGRRESDLTPLTIDVPRRTRGGCWTSSNQCRGCP